MLNNLEKEKLVVDLYYNQRRNVRQIAQEARISFRDISLSSRDLICNTILAALDGVILLGKDHSIL